jgi:hypothetical protein
MDTLIAQAQLPYKQWKPPIMPGDPLNKMLLAVHDKPRWNVARNQCGNAMIMLQLALHAFQSEQGRFPDSLSELTPAYLKKVPPDPFGNGEAVRYRKNGKTYLLYSIGPDGKDDNGKPITRPVKPGSTTNPYLMGPGSKGDYIAGINR